MGVSAPKPQTTAWKQFAMHQRGHGRTHVEVPLADRSTLVHGQHAIAQRIPEQRYCGTSQGVSLSEGKAPRHAAGTLTPAFRFASSGTAPRGIKSLALRGRPWAQHRIRHSQRPRQHVMLRVTAVQVGCRAHPC